MTTEKLIDAIIDNNLDKVIELCKVVDINALQSSTFFNPKGHIIERSIIWSPIDISIVLKRDEISNFLLKTGAKVKSSLGLLPYHLKIINN